MEVSGNDRQRLLEILGGEPGCKRVAQAFYFRVAKSDELKPLFPGKSFRCATEEFAAFLVQFLDGDPCQTQYRWWLSLRESHARFRISEQQRAAWLTLMHETIESIVVDDEARDALQRFFVVASSYIVGGGEGEIKHKELEERWRQQKELDQLIAEITKRNDLEAIALARRFASRPTVFVGILARMMLAGRDQLIEFVMEQIQRDPDLGMGTFNGRSLLHHAVGAVCLPVVRQLLANGIDPDMLDDGGHTPLYRVAGVRKGGDETDYDHGDPKSLASKVGGLRTGKGRKDHKREVQSLIQEKGMPNSNISALIVDELIRAGASVNHTGGVNKSTPLHQAARFGDFYVAEALLKAGASTTARDKNGLTPHDRAVNCRRSEVAALLASR